LTRGLARPWTDRFHVATPRHGLGQPKTGPWRYGAAGGLRGLAVDLAVDLAVEQEVEVQAVGSDSGGRPTVDGTAYDAVVLAMPDPQAAHLLDSSLHAERTAVAGRDWEPVLALAAGYDRRAWDEGFDGCFVHDSDVLAWVADDGRRRGDGAAVLVAHSSPSYAEHRLVDPASAVPDMVAELWDVLGVRVEPAWTFMQRWTFARPAVSREEPFHLGPARVGLCGDGWGAARAETAWVSGTRLGRELARRLG
jgi:predicted NAD/FAD-dependent oxidoreductase